MAAVNHERVLLQLKAHVTSKRSHGQDELLRKIAELEVENEIPEGDEGFDARPRRPRAVPEPTRERPAVAGRS